MRKVLSILFCLTAITANAADVHYTFQPIAYPGGQFTTPTGINDSGNVSGTYTINTPPFGRATHAFLLMQQSGQYLNIDKPGAVDTLVNGINNAGLTVGTANELQGSDTSRHAFARNDGIYQRIEPAGFQWSEGVAINNHNDIYGLAGPTPGDPPFLVTIGSNTFKPGKLGPEGLWGSGLNTAGKIVGFNVLNSPDPNCACYDSFITDGTQQGTTILHYPGAHVTQANAVNDNSQVVGTFIIYAQPVRDGKILQQGGFIWTNGIFQEIVYAGAAKTTVTGVNGFGDVVGLFTNSNKTIGAFLALADRPPVPAPAAAKTPAPAPAPTPTPAPTPAPPAKPAPLPRMPAFKPRLGPTPPMTPR